MGAGPTITFEFPEKTQYDVTLAVTDSAGLSATCEAMVWYDPGSPMPPFVRSAPPPPLTSPRTPTTDHAPPIGECHAEYTDGSPFHVRWVATGSDLGGGDVTLTVEGVDPVSNAAFEDEAGPSPAPEVSKDVDFAPGPHPGPQRYVTAKVHVVDEEDEHYDNWCQAVLPYVDFESGSSDDDEIVPYVTCEAAPTEGRAPLEVVFKGYAAHPLGLLVAFSVSFGDPESPDDSSTGGLFRLGFSAAEDGPIVVKHRYKKPGTYPVGFLALDSDGDAAIADCGPVTVSKELVTIWPDMLDGTDSSWRPAYRETEDVMEIRALAGDSDAGVYESGVPMGFEIVSDSPNGLLDPSLYPLPHEEGGLELRCLEGLGDACVTDADGTVVFEYSSPYRGPGVVSADRVRVFQDANSNGRHDDGEPYETARVTWRTRACDGGSCGCVDVALQFRKHLVYGGRPNAATMEPFEQDLIG